MKSSGRFTLLAYNSVAAVAGAAALLAVVRSVVTDNPIRNDRENLRSAAGPAPTDRLAFVPPGALSPEPAGDLTADATLPVDEQDVLQATDPAPEPRLQQPATLQSSWRFSLQTDPRSPQPTVGKSEARPQSYTLKSRLAELSPAATVRLAMKFEAAKAAWPPAEIALVAIKDERSLELHARTGGGSWTLIHSYRVLAASGSAGPKLRQGDKQVPEGIYAISFLNPNSAYHVALRVNYPNAFDRQMASKDGRRELGGDIMIHGKNLSAGCLAMGDEAIEELFVLAAQTGLPNIKLVIAPTDFRQNGLPAAEPGRPDWLPKLYAEIAASMSEFKAAPRSKSLTAGLLSFFMK